jgi:hypothetical protein
MNQLSAEAQSVIDDMTAAIRRELVKGMKRYIELVENSE